LHRRFNRKLVVGLAALAMVAFAGAAYAATQSSGPDTRQAFLNDVAKRLHVTPQQLTAALNGATIDQLQAAVSAGKLTQAQANALEQRLKNGATALPLLPYGPPHFFKPGGFGAFGPPGPGGPGGALPAAAGYLGLTDMQLLQQLAGGKSLAQVAASKGKSVGGLEQAMTAAVKSKLDKAVAGKAITAAQEQQILKRFESGLSQEVDSKGFQLRRAYLRPGFGGKVHPQPPLGQLFAVPGSMGGPAKMAVPAGPPGPSGAQQPAA
jgi:hypothetical protein